VINTVWVLMIALGVLVAAFAGTIDEVTAGIMDSMSTSVELFLGLIGVMALWTGVMRVAQRSGLVESLARRIRPVLVFLFPGVPKGHPAMGAIVMNVTANMLGLGNAATPLGINAMKELQRLNDRPGTATNAMCTLLVINTSSVQLIPATVIGLRSAAGSAQPTEIIGTTLVATAVSTLVGLMAVKTLERLY
jgi:spore maturation protein A